MPDAVEGKIMHWPDDGGSAMPVGAVSALLIDFAHASDSFVTLDSHNGELAELFPHVFGPYAGVMRPAVARIYDMDGEDMFLDSALYIERIEVEVSHQGQRQGLMATYELLRHFSGQVTLAFCKPFPLHRRPASQIGYWLTNK